MTDVVIAGLSPTTGAFAVTVVLLAAFVRGYSGFGFSALLVASLSLVMAPVDVVPMALMLEITASLHMLPRVWKDIDRRFVGWLLLGAIMALPVGVHMLATVPVMPMRSALYILCLCAVLAIWSGFKIQDGKGTGRIFTAGLFSGVVNGATAMGGLMVVIFLLAGSMAAATMRASLIAYFLILDVYATVFMGVENLLTDDVLLRTALLIPPLLIGNALGHRKFVTTPPESFRRYTLVLLMVISIGGLLRTFGLL